MRLSFEKLILIPDQKMPGLGDSLTVAIVLTLIFGALGFYLYSRLSQNEKRVGLLENLLLSLKMSTEASLSGPDIVEATSAPGPLDMGDVEDVSEDTYAELLKEMPAGAVPLVVDISGSVRSEGEPEVEAAPAEAEKPRKMDANYESMSVKELGALAKQRGLTGVAARKRDLVDALKKNEVPSFEGATVESGFSVELESS
jgi:hypothetical protein